MKKNSYALHTLLLAGTILLTSCATKIPITSRILHEVGPTIENSKQFQYYVSSPIILTLVDEDNESTIEDGQLIRKSKTAREKITIRGNLPGVVRNMHNYSNQTVLEVAFENYEGNPTLKFGHIRGLPTSNYYLIYDNPERKIVQYGQARYTVKYAKSLFSPIISLINKKKRTNEPPYLIIKAQSSHKETAKSRKASGLKLGE